MGYELRITRKEQWHEEGPEIDRQLWRKLVEEDPELKPDVEDGAQWMKDGNASDGLPLYWDTCGNVIAKNPEREARVKMYHLAQKLGAKVQGDEGEVYDANGDPDSGQPSSRGGMFFFLFIVMVLAFILFMFVTSHPQPR